MCISLFHLYQQTAAKKKEIQKKTLGDKKDKKSTSPRQH